jgi:hypothetical protein
MLVVTTLFMSTPRLGASISQLLWFRTREEPMRLALRWSLQPLGFGGSAGLRFPVLGIGSSLLNSLDIMAPSLANHKLSFLTPVLRSFDYVWGLILRSTSPHRSTCR